MLALFLHWKGFLFFFKWVVPFPEENARPCVDSQFFCERAHYESDLFFHQWLLRSQRVNGKWPYPPVGEPCLRGKTNCTSSGGSLSSF